MDDDEVGLPPATPPVGFTEEQEEKFRDALFEAQLSVLAAIRREASREDSFDGPRNVGRLTMSLASLRALTTGRGTGGWFAYAPGTQPIFAGDIDFDYDDIDTDDDND